MCTLSTKKPYTLMARENKDNTIHAGQLQMVGLNKGNITPVDVLSHQQANRKRKHIYNAEKTYNGGVLKTTHVLDKGEWEEDKHCHCGIAQVPSNTEGK